MRLPDFIFQCFFHEVQLLFCDHLYVGVIFYRFLESQFIYFDHHQPDLLDSQNLLFNDGLHLKTSIPFF